MTAQTINCPYCAADIPSDAQKCRYCSEWLARPCGRCGTPLRGDWAERGVCAECVRAGQLAARPAMPVAQVRRKSRGIAAASAFFFGTLGAHRFYLGNPLAGIVYMVFSWTLIPTLAGMFEGIKLALMDDWEFDRRYGQGQFDR